MVNLGYICSEKICDNVLTFKNKKHHSKPIHWEKVLWAKKGKLAWSFFEDVLVRGGDQVTYDEWDKHDGQFDSKC